MMEKQKTSENMTEESGFVPQYSLIMIELFIRILQREPGNLNLIAEETDSRTYQIISKKGAQEDFDHEDLNLNLKTSIITKTHNFLNESTYLSGRKVKTKCDEGILGLLAYGCFLKVFVHGYGEENSGFISILITFGPDNFEFEGYCTVSLIDSSNTERFIQLFSLPYPKIGGEWFCIEKFISRNHLLSDPDEYLPNGILTLKIDIELTIHVENYNFKYYRPAVLDINETFCFRSVDVHDYPIELNLDSNLGECLLKESSFFCRMLDTPMREKKTRFMRIHKNEQETFYNLCILLLRSRFKPFSSIKSIYDMYILADKYDIPFVSEICTCFLKLLASVHNVDEFLSSIRDYEKDVKELLLKTMISIYETNFKEEIFRTERNVSLTYPVHGCFWSYEYTYPSYVFLCRQTQLMCHSIKEQKNDYDFYK